MADLEARIKVLEDIEAIKRLKAKYWRSLDKKQWDELGECFTEDVTGYFPTATSHGRKALVEFNMGLLGDKDIISIHQGHNPEIDITSDITAKAIWSLYDYILDTRANNPRSARKGWAYYEDVYAKENGEWMIKSTTLIRNLFERAITEV